MDCTVALAQARPTLGDIERNLAMHHEWVARARDAGADVLVFPELSLTGYMLKDLTQEVALPLESEQMQAMVALSEGISLVFGFVEESPDHRFFNTTVFAEEGKVLGAHRKVYLPDYGIFEEGRYFAAGDRFEPIESRHGRFGLLVCEDAWHLSASYLHFLDGVDAFLVPSAAPSRGVGHEDGELSSVKVWRSLLQAQALFFQTWSVYCNRTGFEDGVLFGGGSTVTSPFGHALAVGGEEEELVTARMSSEVLRRARMFSPLRRDEKPDIVRRQLLRLLEEPEGDDASGTTGT